MHALIVTRRGVTVGVFTSPGAKPLRHKAEQINGAALTWQNYVSHIGARSGHDDELTFAVHPAQEVS